MQVRSAAARLVWLVMVMCAAPARAQTLPDEPITFADGRVTLAGDVSAGFSNTDRGFFNYTDYDHSALRLLRLDLSAAVTAGSHVSLLGELRSENFDTLQPYAAYVRFRPWTAHEFDIQAGVVPPTFGAFARRTYAWDNPLIGYPLAYQYLTSLRPDSLPASADDLVRRKGVGWRDRFAIGDQTPEPGVPLVNAFRWDTGVQVHVASQDHLIAATAAVTAGTLSNPLYLANNGGRQIAGRVEAHPVIGLIVGVSAGRGPFVSSSAARAAAGDGHQGEFTQTGYGLDVEYSRGHYLARVESIVSDWRLPIVREPTLRLPLRAVSTSVEGRYKIAPGLYVAARVDHLGFSEVDTSAGLQSWDAPVTRAEAGTGISIQRNLLLKLAYQYNRRVGGPLVPTGRQTAAQLVYWF